MIPARDTLRAALVSASEPFEARFRVWQSRDLGLDLSAALPFARHTWVKHRAAPEDLLSEPQTLAAIDYAALTDTHVRGDALLTAGRDGLSHGVLVWFDSELAPGVCFSNAPGQRRAIYGQALFLWPEPVELRTSDVVRFELRADPVGGTYQFTRSTRVERAGAVTASFRQSDFLATPLSPELLRKRSGDFVATLTRDGQLTLRTLEAMQGGASLDTCARMLREHAPERFRGPNEALDFCAELAERFAR
jgi:protein arginine N-methyltransferase 1